ncbi:uncharacterized protein METZ01_LOCUS141589 [marine metagenome]|uniref:tRNA (guanine(46)-N(7))-methyltransferase n=1 Tax=marine metagenome TaxID=408172 RepID=A0A381ZHI8_9ZZZZ
MAFSMRPKHFRKIRSFVRRPGRTTSAQKRALTTLMPIFGVPFEERIIDFLKIFGRDAPRVLDIGFGDGEGLFSLAVNHPDIDYLGVEVHEPGIGHLLLLLERSGITNLKIIQRDVMEVLGQMLPMTSFEVVNLFFPDPWPKKRHHKRRLVQTNFVEAIAGILKPSGLLHIATDWTDYTEHIEKLFLETEKFIERSPKKITEQALAQRLPTKFERRGKLLGHTVRDLYYKRNAD